jgi:Holliday junction resolvasome RuvABC endonuclease subunit
LVVIGIDFSIQFPAACICKDFKEFKWVACVNANTTKAHRSFLEDVQLEDPNLNFVFLDPRERQPKGEETYSGTERLKLANYSHLVDQFIQKIKSVVGDEPSIIVSIEGIAYGAQGNALIDISQATGMLRKAVLDKILDGKKERLFIFSPGELKNAIGAKGNAGKFDVYQVFMQDPKLALNSSLHSCINMNTEKVIKGQEVKSPFMDMIDSYLAVLKIYESLKESN